MCSQSDIAVAVTLCEWMRLYQLSCRGTSDTVNVSAWFHEGHVIFIQTLIHSCQDLTAFCSAHRTVKWCQITKREQRKCLIPDKPVGGPVRWRWGWEWRHAGSSTERSDWCDTSSSRTPRCCSQSGPEGAHTRNRPVHPSINDVTLNDTVKFRRVVNPLWDWINQ